MNSICPKCGALNEYKKDLSTDMDQVFICPKCNERFVIKIYKWLI